MRIGTLPQNSIQSQGSHHATHHRSLPLVPRIFPELVSDAFTIVEEVYWEWLADLPEKERPGRGYEVAGYILSEK